MGPLEVPFDQYQRYRITAEIAIAVAEDASAASCRVLDVGGHYHDLEGRARRPIADFLPSFPTMTVDLTEAPLSGYVRAAGAALPFRDEAFAVVSCVDVLEHVPAVLRDAVLDELLRTARRAVIVAAPFRSATVSRAEDLLSRFIADAMGLVQQQLLEHRQHGLPELAATRARLEASGWSTVVFPYGNLWRWLFMMIDKHALAALAGSRPVHRRLDARYNAELFECDREPPCYRHFLVAAPASSATVLGFVRERFLTAAPERDDVDAPAVVSSMFALAELHAANQLIQIAAEPLRRDTHVAELEAHRAEMYRHIAAKDAYIEKLEAMLRRVEHSPTHKLHRLLRWLSGRADGA